MNFSKQKQKLLAVLCVVCLILTPIWAYAADVVAAPLTTAGTTNGMVRVYLSSIGSKTTLNLTVNGSYSINGNVNQSLSSGEKLAVALNTSTGNITLTKGGQSASMGTSFQLRRHSAAQAGGILIAESLNASNPYPGDMLLTAQKSGSVYKLYAIANVFIEDYLYGVVPYEMGNSAHVEALKAQAVAARTYTLNKMNTRSSALYDVVDTTNDQVYRGTPSGNANCVAAVDGTRGIISMAGNSLVETYYTASNGGQTESSLNAWGSGRTYLTVKDDPFDLANTDAVVKKTTVYGDFSNSSQNTTLKSLLTSKAKTAASSLGYDSSTVSIQRITSVVPHTPKYASPSVLYSNMDFFVTAQAKKSGSVTASTINLQLTFSIFSELESALGMSINSTANELWSVTKSGDNFTVEARRFGHGIGLSQRGAMQMGRLGYNYADILGFYYTGSKRVQYTFTNTILSPISSGGSTTIVTPVDPAELTDDEAPCTATVSLVNKQGSLGIYNAAATTAGIIGAVPNGAPVRVYAIDGAWCFISYGQVYGYAQKSGLTINGTAPLATELKPSQISEYAVVKANGYLNLRQSASSNADILGTAPEGAVLSVFSKESGWAYIQYGSLNAYASTSFLTFSSTYPTAISNPDENLATVNLSNADDTVNLRTAASLSGGIIAKLPHGTKVTVVKNDGSWCQVTYNGQTGFIMTSYLLISGTAEPAPTPERPTEQTLTAQIKIDGNSVTIYNEGNELADMVGTIENGATVTVNVYGMTWCQVRYLELTGYVKTKDLSFAGSSQDQTGEKATVTTQSGSLNLRSKSSAGSSILCTVPRLTVLSVLQRGETWCQVTYNGLTGYVMTLYLTFPGDAVPVTPTPAPGESSSNLTAKVTTVSGSLNLREEAGSGAKVITTIPRNETIPVLEKGDQWCQVSYAGLTGYVMTSFLTYIEAEPTPTPSPSISPDSQASDEPTPTPEESETQEPTPTPEATQGPQALFGTVTTVSGSLNLRQTASTGAKVLCVIPRGTKLAVKEKTEAWSTVTYRGMDGYVMNTYLTFSTEGADQAPISNEGVTATVTTVSGGLNLRTRPESGNNVILSIPRLSRIIVYENGVKWCYVAYNGVYGYVMTSYLSFSQGAAVESVAGEGAIAYVNTQNGGNLNFRDEANGKVIGSIPNRTQLNVISKGASWCQVQYLDSTGYVMTAYLSFDASPTQVAAQTNETAVAEATVAQEASVPTQTPGPTSTPEPTQIPVPIVDPTLKDVQEEIYVMADPNLDWVGIYRECSIDPSPLAKVSEQAMILLQTGDNWCKVQLGDIKGYCLASELVMPE